MDAILMERWLRIALLLLASGGLSCVHSKQAESGEPAPTFGAGLKTSSELFKIEENYAKAMSRRAKDPELKER
jgi:hypothetical protein